MRRVFVESVGWSGLSPTPPIRTSAYLSAQAFALKQYDEFFTQIHRLDSCRLIKVGKLEPSKRDQG
jgi:hypothetical protein